MGRRALPLLVAVSLGGLTVAGCGGGSVTETTSPRPTPAVTSPASGTPATGVPTAPGTTSVASGPGASAARLQQARARCKASIQAQPTLPANVKSQLGAICDAAGSGNPAAARQSAAQICQQIVKTLPPAAQAQASANCPKQ